MFISPCFISCSLIHHNYFISRYFWFFTSLSGNKNLCSGKSCDQTGGTDIDTPTGTSFNSPKATTSSGKKKSNKTPAILGSTIPTFFIFWACVGFYIMKRQRRKVAAAAAMTAGKISNTPRPCITSIAVGDIRI